MILKIEFSTEWYTGQKLIEHNCEFKERPELAAHEALKIKNQFPGASCNNVDFDYRGK